MATEIGSAVKRTDDLVGVVDQDVRGENLIRVMDEANRKFGTGTLGILGTLGTGEPRAALFSDGRDRIHYSMFDAH